jgi:hypothetical protein
VHGWLPDGIARNHRVLVEQNGVTTLATTARYESRQICDTVLKSRMERGVAAGYDRLAKLLEPPNASRGATGA